MNQGLIPRRYAKALLMLATEHRTETGVYEAMQRLDAAFAAEPRLQQTLANPAVSNDDKVKLSMSAFGVNGGEVSEEIESFVKLLIANKRINFLRECVLSYIQLYRQAKKIFKVDITSAAPLLPEETARIKSLVDKELPQGATAEYSELINPELIGGFTVSIDNEVLDASVANELKQLRLKLLSH